MRFAGPQANSFLLVQSEERLTLLLTYSRLVFPVTEDLNWAPGIIKNFQPCDSCWVIALAIDSTKTLFFIGY